MPFTTCIRLQGSNLISPCAQVVELAQWFIGRAGVVVVPESPDGAWASAASAADGGQSASKAVAVCRIKNKFALGPEALVSGYYRQYVCCTHPSRNLFS